MIVRLTAEVVFWLSSAALFYTYAGYPLLLALVSTLRPRKVRRGEFEPMVSIIITAYNDARDRVDKLETPLPLDYPRGLIEVFVASVCSPDRTDQFAPEFAGRGVQLHRQSERLGKTAAQNAAVEKA